MNALSRLSNGRNIILLFLLFLLINLVLIPEIYPRFQTLDTLPSYTPQQAYDLIASYGDQGRQAYLIIELTLDLIYPFISALLFSLAILFTFQRAFPNHTGGHRLALIPFGVMLADYLENASVTTMLLYYPRRLLIVAEISNFFTVTKLVLTPFELLFIVGLIGWLVRVIRARQNQ